MSIKINDQIYGNFVVDSRVLIELIKSEPLQRLKKINQMGMPSKYYHLKSYSRFDHSIGVLLLLKKLNASEEEQVAGLLHDISHTAFSHVVDWVVGDGHKEEFQNDQHERFLIKSEVSKILKKYGYDPKQVSDHKRYKLLEQEIPNPCADRIDYALREFSLKNRKHCVKNLTVEQKRIVFKNRESALIFAKNYLKRQFVHWGGYEAVSRYEILSRALKLALDKKIIEFSDLWEYDDFIIKKLIKSKNKEINKLLKLLKNKSLKSLPKSGEVRYKKFRYVDPEFISGGKILRLSRVDKKFKKEIEKANKINSCGIYIPLVI
ncbi:MAG: HD domain-containing protein [Patescibacteria group bacterium]|nr:HD domain-containing protein [Patescibacteria group bacterium]